MRFLCAGECMVELRHLDERLLGLDYAGDTYNTAVYLRRVANALGTAVEVGYATGLGEDPYSAAMRAAWNAEGVTDRAVTVPGRVPGLYAIRTSLDGERHFTYWRGQSAARAALADPRFWDGLDADLVHLSGITLQLLPPTSFQALVERLRRLRSAGAQVSFDTNFRPAGWDSPTEARAAFAAVLAQCDVVLASVEDEHALHGPETPLQALRRLGAAGAGEVVLRAGVDGAYIATGGQLEQVPATAVAQVVDTTAAGDASAGAYLAARLAGRAPREAVAVANSVAAVVITHQGALVPREVPLLR